MATTASVLSDIRIPQKRELFYGGSWHAAVDGRRRETFSPSTGELLADVAWAGREDAALTVNAAQAGFCEWRKFRPSERAAILRQAGEIIRSHTEELALLDSADCGNPIREGIRDGMTAANAFDQFAGLLPELKGFTLPVSENGHHYTVREPLGVVLRINAYNHPFMFAAIRAAAPLAAGNAVIVKSPDQAPLSSLRLAELIGPLFPNGVFNVLSGGAECGEALVTDPGVAKVALIGSIPTGRRIATMAAPTLKKVALELGGKNALIAFPDVPPDAIARGIIKGMNFSWCGQSCGSTSRAFVHESIYAEVLEELVRLADAIRPGLPTRYETDMGAIVSQAQFDKVCHYIEVGKAEGARLVAGGTPPTDPLLQQGFFMRPTIFADVEPEMQIAREEIFGPVLSVLRWSDEASLYDAVNSVEYGLTASIWTKDLATAHRAASAVEAGFVWVNNAGPHFQGMPFGGYKQSGIGREESLEELIDSTQQKAVNICLDAFT